MTYESSKTFNNLPCAHRRHAHGGHCAFIHGYSRSFTIWFRCHTLSEGTGFVMDFGHLKPVRSWLEAHFDHTLLIDIDDPLLDTFKELELKGACKLITFDNVGVEGSARFVFEHVNNWVEAHTSGRVWVHSVECRENDKNSARYTHDR